VFALVLCALAPVIAAVYGDDRLVGLMLASAYLPIAFALQAPLWIFFRRMEYARQRALQAIQPAVSFAVTVPLAASDFGVYSLIVGPLAGYVVAVAAALAPRRTAWRCASTARPRGATWRSAGRSSWRPWPRWWCSRARSGLRPPGGLAAVGFLTLAVTVTRYVDRADQIVTATIYPAIAGIQSDPPRRGR
jgi:hypothetical protein